MNGKCTKDKIYNSLLILPFPNTSKMNSAQMFNSSIIKLITPLKTFVDIIFGNLCANRSLEQTKIKTHKNIDVQPVRFHQVKENRIKLCASACN